LRLSAIGVCAARSPCAARRGSNPWATLERGAHASGPMTSARAPSCDAGRNVRPRADVPPPTVSRADVAQLQDATSAAATLAGWLARLRPREGAGSPRRRGERLFTQAANARHEQARVTTRRRDPGIPAAQATGPPPRRAFPLPEQFRQHPYHPGNMTKGTRTKRPEKSQPFLPNTIPQRYASGRRTA
jgi:hypothetical protein